MTDHESNDDRFGRTDHNWTEDPYEPSEDIDVHIFVQSREVQSVVQSVECVVRHRFVQSVKIHVWPHHHIGQALAGGPPTGDGRDGSIALSHGHRSRISDRLYLCLEWRPSTRKT